MDIEFNNNLQLKDLISLVDYKAHIVAKQPHFDENGNTINKINAKKLLEGTSPLIAEYCNENDAQSVHFRIYENGYCVFTAEDRTTVFDVVDLVLKDMGYKVSVDEDIFDKPTLEILSVDQMMNSNWLYALILHGEDRITANLLDDTASRPGKSANKKTNVDDGDYIGYPSNIGTAEDEQLEDKMFLDSLIDGKESLLKKKQKEVFNLLRQGYSVEEIAETLGKTRRNISYIKNRGIESIRRSI